MKRKDIPTYYVLMACHKFHSEKDVFRPGPWQILMDQFNAPEKVVYAAMERDFKKGYIEYGVSLRTGWVTEEGYEYLEYLKKAIRGYHDI